ncbi:hypothetical protein [Actinomadura xylanilytica]|uniref:hypothetical protein n=1 Tax=Actinomadura xylanilytica TaxID=887459 RepID=UPI00255ADC26|nr:hypothetical protein [Actinomadura xylanilytica]MDL4775082.1 hypothetical protein [Actinomadura xylanilytica]
MTEDELFAQVRAAFHALDPVPGEVLAAGRSALGLRVPGAGVAGLVRDRARRPGGGGLRGGGTALRALTFAAPGRVVEADVSGSGRYREIAGRIVPGVPALVRVRLLGTAPGELTDRADEAGQFAFPRVPEGLFSLYFQLPDGTSIVTSWIRL